MKYTGTVLELGTTDAYNRKFKEDCEVTYPKSVPVAWEFCSNNSEKVFGMATLKQINNKIIAEADLDPIILEQCGYSTSDKLYVFPFCNCNPGTDYENKTRRIPIYKARLLEICIFKLRDGADESLYLVKSEE